jgi:hypothetical protein
MNSLWTVWGINLNDIDARAYAAGVFDEDGTVKVTLGDAILRVTVGASSEQVPVLRSLHAQWLGCRALLTGIHAQMFLEYVQPYVHCKKAQVDYALEQWCVRKKAIVDHKKLVKNSATGMPRVTC